MPRQFNQAVHRCRKPMFLIVDAEDYEDIPAYTIFACESQ